MFLPSRFFRSLVLYGGRRSCFVLIFPEQALLSARAKLIADFRDREMDACRPCRCRARGEIQRFSGFDKLDRNICYVKGVRWLPELLEDQLVALQTNCIDPSVPHLLGFRAPQTHPL